MTLLYVLIAVCFLVRAVPRVRLPNALVSDSYFHLYCARVIRAGRFSLPDTLPRIVLRHRYTYPFLYHLLLAAFPERARAWIERLTGAIFDTLILVAILAFCMLDGGSGWEPNSTFLAMLALLYALAPGLLRLGTGPRAYNGSPRVMGQMLYVLHALLAYHGLISGNAWALGGSIAAGASIVLTAKFSTQVLVFFGASFGLLVSPAYFLLAAASIALAIAVSGGRAWHILHGSILHSIFYRKFAQEVFLTPHLRSWKVYCRLTVNALSALARGRWKQFAAWYYFESHPVHVFVTAFTPFLVLGLLRPSGLPNNEYFLYVWACSGVFWFTATKMRRFLFLGEGERYLEYALFPALWLFVKYCCGQQSAIFLTFAVYCAISYVVYAIHYQRGNFARNQDYGRAGIGFEALNLLPPGNILPLGPFHFESLCRARFPVVTHAANVEEPLFTREDYFMLYGNQPFPSSEFAAIVQRYSVEYLVTDRTHFDHYANHLVSNRGAFLDMFEPVHESASLLILRVKAS